MLFRNRTHYEILGVSADASLKEIRDAYRQKAREFHPDLNPDPNAVERMQEINEAYEVLRDKEKRAAYNRAHRHFAATEGRLRQAKAGAIVVVGELAFLLGWDVGAGAGNEWAKASIGDENTPGALWTAVFEAALESALGGSDSSSVQKAAREAAWTGAHNETARQARRHALYESAGNVTEAISIDISITVVGVLASTMGRQHGKSGTRIKPRTKAWQDAFEAAEKASLEGLSRYGDMLARGERLRDSAFATIASYAAEAGRVALSSYSERINRETVKQAADKQERPWEDAVTSAERKGRFRRALRKSFVVLLLVGVLILFGGGIAAPLTRTTFDDIVDSLNQLWNGSSIGIPGGGSGQPDTDNSGSVAPLVTLQPTATPTVTPTPTPAPTAAQTLTPIPVSPWVGFIITSETLGKDITDRLSQEETDCLRSSNSDVYYEYFRSEPIGVRVSMNPPVRDVSDLPRLAECLAEESTRYINQSIAVFHDPSLATPAPLPTATLAATPHPTPTATPAPRPGQIITDAEHQQLIRYWLELINAERARGGLHELTLGSNPAAQMHAEDMLEHGYNGHWWADGRDPTQVYSETGGRRYAQENTIVYGCAFCSVDASPETMVELQDSLMGSSGHRRNIMHPSHRVVNLGLAVGRTRITGAQLFGGGGAEADVGPSLASTGRFTFSLSKLDPGVRVHTAIDIYYTPPNSPLTPAQIRLLNSGACIGGIGFIETCGERVASIIPPAPAGSSYTNLSAAYVVADNWSETGSTFSVAASLGNRATKPGIYTVVVFDGNSSLLIKLSVRRTPRT